MSPRTDNVAAPKGNIYGHAHHRRLSEVDSIPLSSPTSSLPPYYPPSSTSPPAYYYPNSMGAYPKYPKYPTATPVPAPSAQYHNRGPSPSISSSGKSSSYLPISPYTGTQSILNAPFSAPLELSGGYSPAMNTFSSIPPPPSSRYR